MKSLRQYAAGAFLRAADIKGTEPIYTITKIREHVFEATADRPAETKLVLEFAETEQELVLNKTNVATLCDLYGDTAEQIVGHRIQLQVVRTQLGDGVQIKPIKDPVGSAPAPVAARAPAAAAAAATAAPAKHGASVKGVAFKKFRERHPHLSATELGEQFKRDVLAWFPGRDPATLTEADWQFYVSRLDDSDALRPDEIPF